MQTKVMICGCTTPGPIRAKCGGAKCDTKPTMAQRLFAREGVSYQDKRYGDGMRLHNVNIAKGKINGYTCTICGRKKLA